MRTRVLASVGAVWTALFGVGYVLLVRSQEGGPAIPLIVLLALAVLAGAVATANLQPRVALIVALALTGLAMIIGLLTIGVLLAPAVAADLVALLLAGRPQKAARTAAMS